MFMLWSSSVTDLPCESGPTFAVPSLMAWFYSFRLTGLVGNDAGNCLEDDPEHGPVNTANVRESFPTERRNTRTWFQLLD